MEVNFDNLRLVIQSQYNLVLFGVDELVAKFVEKENPSKEEIDELRNNMNDLRENIETLVCCYGDSEVINNISDQCNLSEAIFHI